MGSMTITPERAEVLYFTPAYYYTPANPKPLVDEVSKIVEEMHQDGTLTEKWYGLDLDQEAGRLEVPRGDHREALQHKGRAGGEVRARLFPRQAGHSLGRHLMP